LESPTGFPSSLTSSADDFLFLGRRELVEQRLLRALFVLSIGGNSVVGCGGDLSADDTP
jgi:hypothetical protein